MALWRYVLEFPDGRRETRMLAAGNLDAAKKRAERFARGNDARLAGEPVVADATRGSM
ncbi:MAG: hypothetical protein ACYDCK_07900 [Thermoplasmatota archaeon]